MNRRRNSEQMQKTGSIAFIDLGKPVNASMVVGKNVKNHFPRHAHNSYCIGIIDSGVRLIVENKQTIVIQKDEMFIILPGTPHRIKAVDNLGHSYRVVCIKQDVMKSVAFNLGFELPAFASVSSYKFKDGDLRKIIKNFFYHVDQDCIIGQEVLLLALLSKMMKKLIPQSRKMFQKKNSCAAVEKACEFIRYNFADKITLAKLSEVACLSPVYFHKLFLKQKGITPIDYLHKIRLENAKALLFQGADLSEVSAATGFADQSHFTHFFKRSMGITPGRYLQAMRKAVA